MEGRIRSLLLSCVTGISVLFSSTAWSVELNDDQELTSVIQPEIKREKFDEAKIETANFEVIGSFGLLNIENFGVNPVLVGKVVYHLSEDFFTDIQLGKSTAGTTIQENLNPGSSLITDRDLTYFLISLGYNFLPGEAFITDQTTYNSALYLIASLGSTDFAGDTHFTISYGVGYRLLASNHMSVYLDVKDHTFNIEKFGEKKLTHNLEVTFGVSYYF
jgi:outer membrane beta-barrel protein